MMSKSKALLVPVTAFVMFTTFFAPTPTSAAEDYSHNHSYVSPFHKELIEVRANHDQYNQAEAQAMIDRIGKMDERLIEPALNAGVSLILMDFPLTDLPEWAHLRGVVPRGWENTGLTWDDVPGVGGLHSAARIGYSNAGMGHSTVNLELHEFSHAIDFYAADEQISLTESFLSIHEKEYAALFHDHNTFYYFAYPEEYLAEAMAYYYLSDEMQTFLRNRAPQTYQFIKALPQNIESLNENSFSHSH